MTLPPGWARTTIGEIADQINPGFPSGQHNVEHRRNLAHLRPMNISAKGEIVLSDLKYVEVTEYDPLLKGDVLFNNTNSPGALGKTSYITGYRLGIFKSHDEDSPPRRDCRPSVGGNLLAFSVLTGFFQINCRNHVNQASINATFLSEEAKFPPTPPRTAPHCRRDRDAIRAAGCGRGSAAAGAGQPQTLQGVRAQGRVRRAAGPSRPER